jgi:hypothetical protein
MAGSIRSRLFSRDKSSDSVNEARKNDATIPLRSGSASLASLTTNTEPVDQLQVPSPPAEDQNQDSQTASTPLTVHVSAPTVEGPRVETPDLWLLAYERAGFNKEQKKTLLETSEQDEANRGHHLTSLNKSNMSPATDA